MRWKEKEREGNRSIEGEKERERERERDRVRHTIHTNYNNQTAVHFYKILFKKCTYIDWSVVDVDFNLTLTLIA